MIPLFRFLVILLIVQTIVYVGVSIYSRRVRRGKLNAQWDEEGFIGDRDTFVDQGLRDYDKSLRAKLLLGIYVVPIVGVVLIVYLTN